MLTKLLILDRDGVLNRVPVPPTRYINTIDSLQLNYVFLDSLKFLRKSITICVISNQQGVGKGETPMTTIRATEELIQKEMRSMQLKISGFYYCFHLEDEGCCCRKPHNKNFLEAMHDFKVLPEECLYIGDQLADEVCAKSSQIPFCFVSQITDQLIMSL